MCKNFMMLSREILEDPMYLSDRFTRIQAFTDLCYLAAYKERTFMIRGNKVTVKQGQVAKSVRDLASRWHWSVNTVMKFISELKDDGYIDTHKTPVNQVITVKKYILFNTQNETGIETDSETRIETGNETRIETPYNIDKIDNIDKIENKDKKDITSTEGVVAEANDGQNAMINALIEQNELLKRQIEELTKKPKRKKKDPDPAFSEAKNIFTSKYKSLFGQDYYWQAKDAGCMTKLLSQIRFSRKSKGLSDDVEGVIDGLKKFLDYIKDDFILNHFDVSMLVRQYNSIMTGQNAKRGELTGQVLRRERGEYNEQNFFEI